MGLGSAEGELKDSGDVGVAVDQGGQFLVAPGEVVVAFVWHIPYHPTRQCAIRRGGYRGKRDGNRAWAAARTAGSFGPVPLSAQLINLETRVGTLLSGESYTDAPSMAVIRLSISDLLSEFNVRINSIRFTVVSPIFPDEGTNVAAVALFCGWKVRPNRFAQIFKSRINLA